MENTSKQLVPFCFGDNLVRVIDDENGEPWFVAKDVCKALGYSEATISNMGKTIQHVPDEWKGRYRIPTFYDTQDNSEEWRGVNRIHTLGGMQEMLCLTEQGLYFFLGRSDKPKALPFQKWLAGDVMPTLRKTGRYEMPERNKSRTTYALPEEMLRASLSLKPATRQRLWRDSLDTVRLDGGGFEAACQCFASLCGMMAQSRKLPDGPALIFRFMDECLENAKGFNTPGHRIYDLFRLWWDENCEGAAPGRKSFAGYLQTRFEAYKSSVMVYRNCRIRHWQFPEA